MAGKPFLYARFVIKIIRLESPPIFQSGLINSLIRYKVAVAIHLATGLYLLCVSLLYHSPLVIASSVNMFGTLWIHKQSSLIFGLL